jgi:hypothetical protein
LYSKVIISVRLAQTTCNGIAFFRHTENVHARSLLAPCSNSESIFAKVRHRYPSS